VTDLDVFQSRSTHPINECVRCRDAVDAAISHARVTGSVGATWIDDRLEGVCKAKVWRHRRDPFHILEGDKCVNPDHKGESCYGQEG